MPKRPQIVAAPVPRATPKTKTKAKRLELSTRSLQSAPAAQAHADRRDKDEARQLREQLHDTSD